MDLDSRPANYGGRGFPVAANAEKGEGFKRTSFLGSLEAKN
jgi:hypothetical protein